MAVGLPQQVACPDVGHYAPQGRRSLGALDPRRQRALTDARALQDLYCSPTRNLDDRNEQIETASPFFTSTSGAFAGVLHRTCCSGRRVRGLGHCRCFGSVFDCALPAQAVADAALHEVPEQPRKLRWGVEDCNGRRVRGQAFHAAEAG
ncbi:hypothetical protein ACFVZZ_14645 [Streptomyces chartreusis]|uniref:hypothetical protein n=1 Tax=Streptomyces chartreusis TaxID=1969 RepID=UPI0036DA6776